MGAPCRVLRIELVDTPLMMAEVEYAEAFNAAAAIGNMLNSQKLTYNEAGQKLARWHDDYVKNR